MISLSQLYAADDRRGANTVFLHHEGMMQVCQTNDPGTLNTVKGSLQMTSLAFRPVAVANHPNYLLGRDARGFQVAMLTNFGDFLTVWRAAMQAGVANDASIADVALKYCIDAATIVVADLLPQIPNNIEVLFMGHGMACGILAIVREKLRVAGKRVTNMWQTCAPRFCSEETAVGITSPTSRLLRLDDAFCFAPPASIMVNWDPPGTLTEMYGIGEQSLAPNILANQSRFLFNPSALRGDTIGWVDEVSEDILQFSGMRYYVMRMWQRMTAREQAISIEWFNLLNSVFGYTLERRLS